jgi:hypothetical protein
VEIDLADARKDAGGAILPGEGWPDGFVERAATTYAPAPIYADVSVYVDPHGRDGPRPTTFAATLTPLITVRTAPEAAPATEGGLAGVVALLPYARTPPAGARADSGLGATLTDYVSGDAGVPADAAAIGPANLAKQLPIAPGKYLLLPAKPITLPADELDSVDRPVETPVFQDFAAIVVSALDAISYDDATRAARADYVTFFDPALGAKLRGHDALTASDAKKLDLLRRFEQAEWRMLGAEDEQFVSAVYDGDWGAGVRTARVGEEDFVKQRKAAIDQANSAALMSLAAGVSSMRFSGTSSEMMQSEMQTMSTAMTMMQTEQSTSDQLAVVTNVFEGRMLDIDSKGQRFLFTVDSGDMSLEARSLSDLRAKMKVRYDALTHPRPAPPPPAEAAAAPPPQPAPQTPTGEAAPDIAAPPPASPPLAAVAQPASGPPAPPTSEASPAELAFWQSVAMSNDPAQYQAYLNRFPNGLFSEVARAKMAQASGAPASPPARTVQVPIPAPVQVAASNAAPPSAGQPSAPTPLPPAVDASAPPPTVPVAPVLDPAPTLHLPASFCSEADQAAFREGPYRAAAAAAAVNSDRATRYLAALEALQSQYAKAGNTDGAARVAAQIQAYQPVSVDAFLTSTRYSQMAESIRSMRIVACN